jgi:hypothetical protein
MGKLTLGAGFDAEGLDEAEYDDSFEPYSGPLPPNGTVLKFRLVKLFSTESGNGDFMLKDILVAEESGEYDGLTIFDNIVFTEKAAFRYQPFMAAFGLTAKLIKAKTIIGDDEDERFNGYPVVSIGRWQPGSDKAVCFVKVTQEEYNDEMRPRAGKYIALDSEDAPENYRAPKPGTGKPQATRRATAKPPEDDSLFGDDDPPPF